MKIRQNYDQQIEVGGVAGSVTYRHGAAIPKPCLHPVVTPAGTTLTGFEMSDHVWHRGLWFTIKFINGENFWEENAPFGLQSSVMQPAANFTSPTTARIDHLLSWTSEASGVVLREVRSLGFDQRDGFSFIDWTTALTANRDLTLDRTPYTTWGGYSGLIWRTSREFHGATFTTPGGGTTQQLLGDRHEWALLQGKVDGGLNRLAAIGIVDHPSNPRGPTPWYGKCADGYIFFNAAFLFHEPMTLKQGETLTFKYRVFYRDGHWTHDEFALLAHEFRELRHEFRGGAK
jgi:hypothetical protein